VSLQVSSSGKATGNPALSYEHI